MSEGRRNRLGGLARRLNWHRISLRSRIALIAAIAVAVTVVVVSGVVFLAVAAQLRGQLDQQLVADAHAVAERPGNRTAGDDHDNDRDVGPRIQFLDDVGRPILAAGQQATLPVTPAALQVARNERARAFEDIHVGGGELRMLTTPAEHGGTVQVALSTDSVTGPLSRIGLVLGVVSVCGVAVAAVLGFVVARTGLTPVNRLTRAVEHVAATNDLSSRITVSGHDEIARLAHAFNAMLSALQSSRTAQRLLVEDAGHELRTPLTSLRANIELLIRVEEQAEARRTLSAEDRAGLLSDLDDQTAELTQMVNELVELAHDEGSAEPVEQVDLTELVEAAVQRVARRWPETTFTTELDPIAMTGRPDSLERMVSNLLDNAAKWSPKRTPVRICLRSVTQPPGYEEAGSETWAELTVADSGPGIDEADLPRIFERFYRATAARARPGAGLGLAIVAQAVELHSGTVGAGRSDTGGALFTVRLPGARPAAGDFSSTS